MTNKLERRRKFTSLEDFFAYASQPDVTVLALGSDSTADEDSSTHTVDSSIRDEDR